ncbi:hypothetical protein EYF80_052633 [Liparis tanakae]|uniref:Uncharacterized protein n=1 Tax=Liparis tanakae TaxID=230148 RepID=A0A4Z2F7I1_9TELE|nr:hypothetical protein EYF80_052633 [Liparis tanakae]
MRALNDSSGRFHSDVIVGVFAAALSFEVTAALRRPQVDAFSNSSISKSNTLDFTGYVLGENSEDFYDGKTFKI